MRNWEDEARYKSTWVASHEAVSLTMMFDASWLAFFTTLSDAITIAIRALELVLAHYFLPARPGSKVRNPASEARK